LDDFGKESGGDEDDAGEPIQDDTSSTAINVITPLTEPLVAPNSVADAAFFSDPLSILSHESSENNDINTNPGSFHQMVEDQDAGLDSIFARMPRNSDFLNGFSSNRFFRDSESNKRLQRYCTYKFKI
jgi:hypothetical protein